MGEAVLANLIRAAAHLLEAAEAAARDRVGDVDDPRVAEPVPPVAQDLQLRQVADVEEPAHRFVDAGPIVFCVMSISIVSSR